MVFPLYASLPGLFQCEYQTFLSWETDFLSLFSFLHRHSVMTHGPYLNLDPFRLFDL